MILMAGCYGLTQMMPEEERKKAEAEQKKMGIVCDARSALPVRACANAFASPAYPVSPSAPPRSHVQDPSNPLSLLQAAWRGGPPEERPRPAAGAAAARRAVTR
jgi:hypothetical protein